MDALPSNVGPKETRARQKKFQGTPRPRLRLGSGAGSDAAVSHAAPGQPTVLFARPTRERIPAWLCRRGAAHGKGFLEDNCTGRQHY